MKAFGRVVLSIVAATLAVLAAASWATGPSFTLLGPFHYMALMPTLAGFVLLVVEWRTRGAHNFVPTGLALAAASLLMGLFVGASGMKMMFNLLATEPYVSDAVRFRQTMAIGLVEAAGLFHRYVAMAALQVVLWAMMIKAEPKTQHHQERRSA